ncbi:MAG: hypothetical protein R3324_18155 [Halobacteriales archaeon]|nr:hypothetical protein [Halobacteriales archaeon]
MTTCPVCDYVGSLETVRAHVTVQGRVDGDHAEWLEGRGIDLSDDTQASVSELTQVLARSTE